MHVKEAITAGQAQRILTAFLAENNCYGGTWRQVKK
jgi:hypothetical protein